MSAELTANFQRLEQRLDNDLNHICDFIRYMHNCIGDIYDRFDWPAPLPHDRSQPLPSIGPPFGAWVPPPAAPKPPASPEDPDFPQH